MPKNRVDVLRYVGLIGEAWALGRERQANLLAHEMAARLVREAVDAVERNPGHTHAQHVQELYEILDSYSRRSPETIELTEEARANRSNIMREVRRRRRALDNMEL